MLGSEFPGRFLFGHAARIQVAETLQFFRLRNQRRCQELRRYPGRIRLELTALDMIESKQRVHSVGAIQLDKLSSEHQAIKTLQDTRDEQGKAL